jgi:hypothetical protein
MDRRTFLSLTAGTAAGLALAGTTSPASARCAAGITWPTGQALPRFPAPASLVMADIEPLAADQQLLLATLQGVVNRTKPRIYLQQKGMEGKATWLPDLGVPTGSLVEPLSLVSRFRSEITGAVLYDPALPATINLATTLAGLENAVATSAAVATQLSLPIVADLRGQFANELAAYQWAIDTLRPRTTHRMLISHTPDICGYLRDYAVANSALVVWLDHSDAAQRALLQGLADDLPLNAPFIGWLRGGESQNVQSLSKRGVHVLPADFMQNLTVWSGVPATLRSTQPHPAPPALEDKIYVTLVYSDGDNMQYAQHRTRLLWEDPARGSIPLNWPLSPELVDAAPAILSHYQRTATANDYLLAGPSGLGYIFPSAWPLDTFDTYVTQTATYAHRAGMDSTVIINRQSSSDTTLPTYVALPEDKAAIYSSHFAPTGMFQNWSDYNSDDLIVAGIPIGRSRLALSAQDLKDGLAAARAKYDSTGGPVFTTLFLLSGDVMTPTTVAQTLTNLDPLFRLVRGDQYFTLLRQAYP